MKKLSEYDQSAVKQAQTAFGAILGLYNERDNAALKGMPPSGLLYHYTTAEGLKGIIENNELWATSAYFLNDPTEITYGYNRLREVLDKWLANARVAGERDSLRFILVTALRETFGKDLLEKKLPIYLACFCEEDNLLSQWRAYGQSGGYSVGFRVPTVKTVSLGQGFRPEPNTYTSTWAKVEYNKIEQVRRCDAALGRILDALDPGTGEAIRKISEHPFYGYAALLTATQEVLLEEIVRFKNEAFNVEKEWRIIVRRREFLKQAIDDGGKEPMKVYFRTSNGMVVPYVKLIPTDKPPKTLPIQRIRTGPTLDKETAKMAITLMLEKRAYAPVPVDGSDILVRL